jgi:hypothetical protein
LLLFLSALLTACAAAEDVPAQQETIAFTVTNNLPNPIQIRAIRYNPPHFNVTNSTLTLQPGATSAPIPVTCQPKAAGLHKERVTFQTDQLASTGIDNCVLWFEGTGVDVPPRVSGPYTYEISVSSTTIGGDGVARTCSSPRQIIGTLTIALKNVSGILGGDATLEQTETQTGGTCGSLPTVNQRFTGKITGTLDTLSFTIITAFSHAISTGTDTLHFSGQLSQGVVSGSLSRVHSFTHNAGNGGGGGSASTSVTLTP